MTSVLVFDVNETLLDLRVLDPVFEAVLGDASLRSQWFASTLQLSFVGGLTGRYVDFTTAQQAALRMTATQAGRQLTVAEVDAVVGTMRQLQPHPEVPDALRRLQAGGFRLVALTNSVLDVAHAQLAHAGLTTLFEAVFSADEARSLKPAPQPYRMVAERCAVAIEDTCLVAAHPWDISGAVAAGARAGFVARSGAVPSPLGAQPSFIGSDLSEVADHLLAEQPGPS